MDIPLTNLWTASGILLGFQVSSFAARVTREVTVWEQKGTPSWLPPADMVNLLSLLVLVIGVFILPVLGLANQVFMRYAFGLAVLLSLSYPFALAGHYDLYNNKTGCPDQYFPYQEKVVVTIIVVLAMIYILMALIKR